MQNSIQSPPPLPKKKREKKRKTNTTLKNSTKILQILEELGTSSKELVREVQFLRIWREEMVEVSETSSKNPPRTRKKSGECQESREERDRFMLGLFPPLWTETIKQRWGEGKRDERVMIFRTERISQHRRATWTELQPRRQDKCLHPRQSESTEVFEKWSESRAAATAPAARTGDVQSSIPGPNNASEETLNIDINLGAERILSAGSNGALVTTLP